MFRELLCSSRETIRFHKECFLGSTLFRSLDKAKAWTRQRTDSCNPPHDNTEVSSHTPGGIRTPNPLIRSQMLYPVELPVHSEEIDTMSLAINQVNAFEGLERSLIINNENFGL